ncbi:hypothetical protein [Pseudonocardia spinosispora]|uniref:hypothetical protein n=1 Tax=Pseudonocardia spinosispora TaxID=103441 RepID=UPI00041E8A09|nr:hypothetical protein [Pseudonocardia spinosispora]
MDELVELLHRHDPERAERVRARLSGSAPDGVLILGPDVPSVGRLAMVVAARVPGRAVCAPVEAPPAEELLRHTRAVVWVFHTDVPMAAPHWARFRELAGEVDEVHLALAGVARYTGWRDGERLAHEVPRLAGHPVHVLAGSQHDLVDALSASATSDAGRNALRVLRTGVDEQLHRGEARREHAVQRELAVDRALRRHRQDLGAARRETAGTLPKRVRGELAAARAVASTTAAEALRRLRDDAGAQLYQLDGAGRLAFPDRFGAAGIRLTEELVAGFDRALDGIEGRLGVAASAHRGTPAPPRPRTPLLRTGVVEARLMLVLGASAGLGLGRAAMASEHALPVALGPLTVPLAVGIGAGLAWLVVAGRRAMSDRARLRCWVAEVVGDLRIGVEATLTERVRLTEQRLTPLVERYVGERSVALDIEQRRHEVVAHRVLQRSRVDHSEPLTELRRAGAELDRLLADASSRAVA